MPDRRGLLFRAFTYPRGYPSHHCRRRDHLRQLPASKRDRRFSHFWMLRKRVSGIGKHQGRRQRHYAGGCSEETEQYSDLLAVIGGDIDPCTNCSTYQMAMQAHAMY